LASAGSVTIGSGSAIPTFSSSQSASQDASAKERELDLIRQRKDAEEQVQKNTRQAALDAQLKLAAARAKAEEDARKIVADATRTAKKIIAEAQGSPMGSSGHHGSHSGSSWSSSSEGRRHRRLNPKNSILLKAANTSPAIDDEALGLAPTMSVDPNDIHKGHKLARKADFRHDDFENQHEIDCKLPVCTKNGKKTTPETKV